MRIISGRQNPVVRAFRSVAGGSDIRGERVLLDGAHLVRDARDSGIAFELVAVASSRLARDTEEGRLAHALEGDGVDVVMAPDQLFGAISPVRTPSGIVAIAQRRPATALDICGPANAFVLVAVDVQDPGNVGSLLRSAEAGGCTGAFICGTPGRGSANPFSWKALRGSMGSALRLPIVAGVAAADAMGSLAAAGVRTFAAVPRDGRDPETVEWPARTALVVGGEGEGLDGTVVDACDGRVTIPMASRVESLNVAVAAGILVYAVRRTRRPRQ